MPYGDGRTAQEIRAGGDELSVEAAYSPSGVVPGALAGDVLSDTTGYKGGTYAQATEAAASSGDDPQDYINAGYLDEGDYSDTFNERPSDPGEAHSWDVAQANQQYIDAVAAGFTSSLDDAAQAFNVDDTELMQAHTYEVLQRSANEANAMGASWEQINQNFLNDPQHVLREAALVAAQEIHDARQRDEYTRILGKV